ncbi:MAG: gliding motility-associated C-terminal domain-containing protein [bacterium]|nr:gliding motility-associated C-terminal domain-containing protein [bacterium]
MNNDGLNDVIVLPIGEFLYNYFYILYQKTSGELDNPIIYSTPLKSVYPYKDIETGDLNNDKRNDLVVSDSVSNCIYLFCQNTPPEDITLTSPVSGSVLGDATPVFKLKSYDKNNDPIKYKIEILKNNNVVNTFNQSLSVEGWDEAQYDSLQEASFTLPENNILNEGSRYTIKVTGYDGFDWTPENDAEICGFQVGIINIVHNEKDLIFSPNNDGVNDYIVFSYNTSAKIKIFNIYGKLIIELSNSDKWSGRDKDNNLLPSGVYLYQVHENNQYYTGTLTLAR